MNYTLRIIYLSVLTSASVVFGGKITIYNETSYPVQASFSTYSNIPIPGTVNWTKQYREDKTLVIEPKNKITYEASAPSGYLVPILNTPIINYYGLTRFDFASPSKFIVKGAAGETYSDYSKIDIPELGAPWELWIKTS